ncbi:MAG: YtxH domain-containing protein [Defluviitaleaceae bacterium]|nr:YtxH domain-containing protein [Defluviitaleaceae bacterium]MCL2275717.1 YtxH domain-containing protein [Defluviitaleaceae bacterium]
MHRFTGGLVSGIAVGIAVGMGIALSDDKYRHRMAKDGRRAMRKANHLFDDIREMF